MAKICSWPGCDRTDLRAKGLCARCYLRQRRRNRGVPERPQWKLKNCSAVGCDFRADTRGLCKQHYLAAYHKARPQRRKELALKQRFGAQLDFFAYQKMLEDQSGRCAICKSLPGRRALSVDHDHATGAIRALLCHSCNTGLGHFKDSPALLNEAVAYLTRFRNGN